MKAVFLVAGVGAWLVLVAQRCYFLAPKPWGAAMYFANVLAEAGVRKLRLSRRAMDVGLAIFAVVCLFGAGVPPLELAIAAALTLAIEIGAMRTELDAVTRKHVLPNPLSGRGASYPGPSFHPDLIVNIVGPFVARSPRYDLGVLTVGRQFELTVMIGNHSPVPSQVGIALSVEAPPALKCPSPSRQERSKLEPGEVWSVPVSFMVREEWPAGTIRIDAESGPNRHRMEVVFAACRPEKDLLIRAVAVSRYPGARRSAFSWRGDMDLYDETTFQSIEGLERALALGARYRVAQSMFLSTRLSLDEEEAAHWASHHGIDRGASRIPAFVEWIRTRVDLRHIAPYPFSSDRSLVMELGNHGHLHYGTDTSDCEQNGWKRKARFGAGDYPWVSKGATSFEEQRDNGLEARRLCEERLGFTPRSWALPDRTNDTSTAAALEAAGCEVLSGSDITSWHNVVIQPPPHHPPGTTAVELTVRHPGDPLALAHVAMFRYWLHRGHRLGIPVVFMGHQHLHQGKTTACLALTEIVLREALAGFHGDLYVDTVFGVGKYWKEVLSDETRTVSVVWADDAALVTNGSDIDLRDVPVDFDLGDSGRFCVLCDVPAGGAVRISGRDSSWTAKGPDSPPSTQGD